MSQEGSGSIDARFDVEEAAAGVRRFFLEPHATVGLRHLTHGLWRQAVTLDDLAVLLYAAGEVFDLTKEKGEADFCLRMAILVRAYHEQAMDVRGFAVAALGAAGFDGVRQVEIARLFEAHQDAAVRGIPLRLAVAAERRRRHGVQALWSRLARLLQRPFARPVPAV